jgi:hypothetical protein
MLFRVAVLYFTVIYFIAVFHLRKWLFLALRGVLLLLITFSSIILGLESFYALRIDRGLSLGLPFQKRTLANERDTLALDQFVSRVDEVLTDELEQAVSVLLGLKPRVDFLDDEETVLRPKEHLHGLSFTVKDHGLEFVHDRGISSIHALLDDVR